MKKLFLTLALGALSLGASAQYQLYNSDFEEWEEVRYTGSKICEEPVRWSSFYDATGSMKSSGTGSTPQIYKDTDVRPGSNGNYSVRITSRSVFGIVAQGNFTNGCVNMGSMTATDASGNYNYVNESRPDQSMPFSGHPDAVRIWVRFSGVRMGNVSVMLTTKGYFQDPAYENRNVAHVVAHATNNQIASNDSWTEYVIPFEVDDESSDPYYCLTNISTCADPGAGNAADYMYIDDMEMIYNSEATSVMYNGKDILSAGSYDGLFDSSLLTDVTTNGRGATWTSEFDYNAYALNIIVRGEDYNDNPSNEHRYTIQFVKPNADLTSAMQDGVNLLEDASSVIYDASKIDLQFNGDVTSHVETFDYNTCRLTIVMRDVADNEIKRVIQFHVPAPAIETAIWQGVQIPLEGFTTGDVYDEAGLVLTPNADATLERSYDAKNLLLVVVAKAPEGYGAYNKSYTFKFGMGEMLDPSDEAIQPVALEAGKPFFIVNKSNGLLLTDKDILGTELTQWTFAANNTVCSSSGTYLYIHSTRSWFVPFFQESTDVTTSGTTSRELTIQGDAQNGYLFMATDGGVGWSRTARLSTSGTFLDYVLDEKDVTDACRWLLYDVDAYAAKRARVEVYNEIQRAQQLGLDVIPYRQTYDANVNNAETLNELVGTIRQDESDFVEGKYTLDKSELLGSTKLSDAQEWNTTMVENFGGQHWSGDNLPYYEQSWNQYDQGNWEVSASKSITLPAGKYVFKATARCSALAEAYMEVNGKRLLFPANGDTGRGVDVTGDVNYSPNGTYANNNIGRGWEYRYLQFDVPEDGEVTIKIGGSGQARYQWLSISDMFLLAQPVPEMRMVSFGYDGQTYQPNANNYIDLSDVYYRADVQPEIQTLGYGLLSAEYDEENWQYIVTLQQEADVNYGFADQVYTVQFHRPEPQLATLTFDGQDILNATYVDQYYSAGKLAYTGNVDTQNIQVNFDRSKSLLTVTVSGYGQEKTYEFEFKSASAVSTEYTEQLLVTINTEKSEPKEVTVLLRENPDGTYDFELPNFFLNLDGEEMPIGTIVLTGIQMQLDATGANSFRLKQEVAIAPGDQYDVPTDLWYGPWLGQIPVEVVEGTIFEGRLNVHIRIDMRSSLDQIIDVKLGNIAVTGIEGIQAAGEATLFNLQGQRTDRATKGIVVRQGSKFIRR